MATHLTAMVFPIVGSILVALFHKETKGYGQKAVVDQQKKTSSAASKSPLAFLEIFSWGVVWTAPHAI